ncbi:hypothetical protein DFH09DRAFT_1328031 [Mycena vulgaris]|nr:hypothetical protein DFH09DRAFT_1332784 [Mycena vulgaris]KAJ6527559.1 hypothetical protein DFH09DRAFT_1328031 [Mycena vulgaris]
MDPAFQDLVFQEIFDFERDTERRQRTCAGCAEDRGAYCCRNCLWSPVLCQPCMLLAHEAHPLHRIEVVSGDNVKGTTLKMMGLRIQLGHGCANYCPEPIPDSDFTILDMYGTHDVSINYCGCTGAPTRGEQLKAARLYPLPWNGQSYLNPHSAVTFEVARCHQDRISERLPRPRVGNKKRASGTAPRTTTS